MLEKYKNTSRILKEMHVGMLAYGIICQIIGVFLVKDQLRYAGSLWLGILMAIASSIHLYRSLDKALDYEASAHKMMFKDYMIRYTLVAAILIAVSVTDILNPLIVFLAYLSLKVSALIQPFTHKLLNKVLGEVRV